MLMTAEDVVRTRLDAMYPKPVRYVGQPECNEGTTYCQRDLRRALNADIAEKARKRTEQIANLQFERRRKAQIAAANPDVMTILTAVSATHGIVLSLLLSKNRTNHVVRARHHAVWELKQRKPNMTSPKIASVLHRDHSTILSSLQVFEKDRHLYADQVHIVAQMLAAQVAA